MREIYRHTQFCKGLFWALTTVLVMDVVFVVMIVSKAGAEPWLVAVLGATMILMLVLLSNYAYLTVTVTKEQIRLCFGKGPFAVCARFGGPVRPIP